MSIPFLSEIFSITLIYWWEPSSLFFRPPTTPLRMMSEYHYTSRPRGLSPPQAGATAALSKGAPREVHVIWAHPKLAQLAHMSPGAAADRVNTGPTRSPRPSSALASSSARRDPAEVDEMYEKAVLARKAHNHAADAQKNRRL
ncbi:hypothetical protein VUR80DRAFT_9708 [Thermomyces stellatus]